jgi:putative FmdB family regulatory protein
MPIYEYRCHECEAVFEVIQKFSDEPIDECESCGAKNPAKLVSTSAFHLKGGGWYATDYSGKTTGSSTETESKSESDTESKSESDTESKSESTTESKSESTTESKSESTTEATSASENTD